jgi:hypothetical protein
MKKLEIEIFTEDDLEPEVIATIDFLRKTRKLSPAKCYVLLTILLEGFPEDDIPKYINGKWKK